MILRIYLNSILPRSSCQMHKHPWFQALRTPKNIQENVRKKREKHLQKCQQSLYQIALKSYLK